jgi:tRNA(fMet)-specific endonuclease VapC
MAYGVSVAKNCSVCLGVPVFTCLLVRATVVRIDQSHHVEQNRAALDALLNGIRVHPLESETSEHYGRTRAQLSGEGHTIGNNDMWIAAHALTLGVWLVTHKTAKFSRVADLVIDSRMG